MITAVGGLPAGIVTFVFTDIEASTRLFHRIGDRFLPLLERHNRILHDAWTAYGGVEVRNEGDGFFVAFADSSAALAACAAAQAALAIEPWPVDTVIRVRMGVHCGLAHPHRERLHRVRRARGCSDRRGRSRRPGGLVPRRRPAVDGESAAHSSIAWHLPAARLRLPRRTAPAVQPRSAGRLSPASCAACWTARSDSPTTILVGREADLAELQRLVSAHRLVSVVGPGGLGKTRLVAEWGLTHAFDWPDGVWFADLACVTDAQDIPEALAASIGASVEGGGDVWHDIAEHFRDRRCAVIVDNCEHLLGGVAWRVDALLAGCGGVHVVTTSREPLGLRARAGMAAPTLPARGASAGAVLPARRHRARRCDLCSNRGAVPTPRRSSPRDEARRRTHRECPVAPGDFAPDRPSEAAREPRSDTRRSTSGHQLALRLEDYGLLSPPEQAALRRLAVFAAGFDLDAAGAAVAHDGVDVYEAVELVWALLEKSLLVHDPAAGDTRYRMLMTVRTYARHRLEASGELAEIAPPRRSPLPHFARTPDREGRLSTGVKSATPNSTISARCSPTWRRTSQLPPRSWPAPSSRRCVRSTSRRRWRLDAATSSSSPIPRPSGWPCYATLGLIAADTPARSKWPQTWLRKLRHWPRRVRLQPGLKVASSNFAQPSSLAKATTMRRFGRRRRVWTGRQRIGDERC